MADEKQEVQINVYIDEVTKAALDGVREREGIPVSSFVRLAIADRLEMIKERDRLLKKNDGK